MQWAAHLASLCRMQDCVLLKGDLGAGKTTFARGFIHQLCPDAGEIVSPTFTLMQTYGSSPGAIVTHFDLYRLQRPQEILELGLEEALASSICLVEWPQKAENYMPSDALQVEIGFGKGPEERTIRCLSPSPNWQKRLRGRAA